MTMIAILILSLVFGFARSRSWSPAVRATDAWARVQPSIWSYLRRSPATFIYLGILSITTWVLLGLSDKVTTLLLLEHSTNLHELRINPAKVLIRSAFWAPGYQFLPWLMLFAVVLAPAEAWLGTSRWVTVFITGHFVATIASATALWFGIRYGVASRHLQETIDVGVSYGFVAVASLFTFRLPTPWRWLWAVGALGIGIAALLIGQSFTDVGHLIAIGIGFAFYPITRGQDVRSRYEMPIWSTRSAPASESGAY
jgi:hypothetical protein